LVQEKLSGCSGCYVTLFSSLLDLFKGFVQELTRKHGLYLSKLKGVDNLLIRGPKQASNAVRLPEDLEKSLALGNTSREQVQALQGKILLHWVL